MKMNVFLFFLILRIVLVFLVRTWYVPDEYWQSLEVAHKLVFNYGCLTWEWNAKIRSYVYPLIISALYKILHILRLDLPEAVIYGPRILQSILSAYSDLCFYIWAGRTKWAIFCISSAWFWFYVSSRTLINTFETNITTIALLHFPWNRQSNGDITFLILVAAVCVIRPTAVIHWLPLCIYHLYISKEKALEIVLKNYLHIGAAVLFVSTAVDSIAHGSLVLTSFEFLKLNVLKGVGNWYGVHPWYWYLSSGLPTLLGIQILPFMMATVYILKNRYVYPNELILLGCIVFTVTIYSLLPHKEFRFILPLLPMVLYINSKYLSQWSRKADRLLVWFTAGTLLIGDMIPALYLSMVHQKGTLTVMTPLREMAMRNPENTSFLFLMPCHSTPLYSHLHVNIPVRFLTCEPNLKNEKGYVDEADQFYKNPSAWLRSEYPPRGQLPSHIISFDVLTPFITDILSRYKPVYKIFHTHTPTERRIGQNVMIYELVHLNQ